MSNVKGLRGFLPALLKLCGNFLFVYFVQINNIADTEYDRSRCNESYIVQHVVKAVIAKINNARCKMYYFFIIP